MGSPVGGLLRDLRVSRQMTLDEVAQRAAVNRVTLSRWESGAHLPRLPELEAALAALNATEAQREEVLIRMDAPRAVRCLRRKTPGADGMEGSPPTAGDLLRALRHRRGLTLEQVASGLGMQPRTVSRWERGETAPPADSLDALCCFLNVDPEERAALTQRHLWLAAPDGSAAVSLERAARQVALLTDQTERGEQALMELRFLTLEAQLWPQARHHPSARRLLAETLTCHARWLSYRERIAEAGRLANSVLKMAREEFRAESFFFGAVFVSAVHAAGERRAAPLRAVEVLREWLPFATRPEHLSWIYRDMAEFASAGGQIAAALEFIGRAGTAAERAEDEDCVRLSRQVHAGVLLRAGRPREALALLPESPSPVFIQAFFQANRRVAALLAVGDRSAAQDWLRAAYQLADAHDLPRRYCDELALRL